MFVIYRNIDGIKVARGLSAVEAIEVAAFLWRITGFRHDIAVVS